MTLTRKIFACALMALLLSVLTPGTATAEVTDHARVTVTCGVEPVSITLVTFVLNGGGVFTDPAPGIGCDPLGGDSKLYEFSPELDINGFSCIYTCGEGGAPTTLVLNAGHFFFHMPIVLPCPSPGGDIGDLEPGIPAEGDAWLVVSDHDVLMWPASECFAFTGGMYDYVCVLWYCETDYPPVFSVFEGCNSPCGDPSCPPADFLDVGYTPIYNPVPNVYARLFWPIGLMQPGCWCYYFEFQLPVQLASFDAIPTRDAIRVQFATASELGNEHFEIMRGTSESGPFVKVTDMASQGDATNQQNYEFVDSDVAAGQTYWYYLAEVDLQGHRAEHRDLMRSAAAEGAAAVPEAYALAAYPNPFNPATTLSFTLPVSARAEISVYDATGRLIEKLAGANFEAGTHQISFNASNLPTGIYLARLSANDVSATVKLLLIK